MKNLEYKFGKLHLLQITSHQPSGNFFIHLVFTWNLTIPVCDAFSYSAHDDGRCRVRKLSNTRKYWGKRSLTIGVMIIQCIVTENFVPNYQSLFFKLTQLAKLSQKNLGKPRLIYKRQNSDLKITAPSFPRRNGMTLA